VGLNPFVFMLNLHLSVCRPACLPMCSCVHVCVQVCAHVRNCLCKSPAAKIEYLDFPLATLGVPALARVAHPPAVAPAEEKSHVLCAKARSDTTSILTAASTPHVAILHLLMPHTRQRSPTLIAKCRLRGAPLRMPAPHAVEVDMPYSSVKRAKLPNAGGRVPKDSP
jgi:hypothetical protein